MSSEDGNSNDDEGWMDKLSDGVTSQDILYLVLIGIGVLVLTIGLVYCICRICCYDFWAGCCGKVKTRLSARGSNNNSIEDGSRWGTMDKKELMKQVILQNNRDRQKKASDQWANQRRRASDLSFAPGDEDDQIIYHEDHGYVDKDFSDTFTSRRSNNGNLALSSSGFGNSLSVPGTLPGMMGSPPTEQPPGRRKSDGRGYF